MSPSRTIQRGFGVFERLLCTGTGLEQCDRAVVGLLRVLHRGFLHLQIGDLQIKTPRAARTAEIVFANPQHDYPQRIRYWRDGMDLNAEISTMDGSQAVRWHYRRQGGN